MTHLKTAVLALALLCAPLLRAQSNVQLIENNGKMALFAVEAAAPKAGDVASAAIRALFVTLLDEGVEGFAEGKKLMQKPNAKWRENFLKEKNPPYLTYVKGIQTEGEPLKSPVGDYRAIVLVRLNADFLFRQLKAYGILNR